MKYKIFFLIFTLLSVQAYPQFTAREYFKFGKTKFDDGKYFEAIESAFFKNLAMILSSAFSNAQMSRFVVCPSFLRYVRQPENIPLALFRQNGFSLSVGGGIWLFAICWIISRIEVASPPGVSNSIKTIWEPCRWA